MGALRSAVELAQYCDSNYKVADYIDELYQKVMKRAIFDSVKCVVCAPPRHGKSLFLCRYALAYYMLMRPSARVILASNALRTAQRHLQAVRDVLYMIEPNIVRQANLYELHTTRGGSIITAGIRSTLLGVGAELIIVDDPYRHILEAFSPRVREQVESWFDGTLMSRLHRNGSIIVVQQRMHPLDLAGLLISRGWESYVYPAIKDGQPLFPELYSLENLNEIRKAVGERFFSALYLQQPLPDAGSIFVPELFQHVYTALPEQLLRVVSVDTAITAKESADYTAWSVWGWDGHYAYLIDMQRTHIAYASLKRTLASIDADIILVEDANVGSALHQELRGLTKAKVIAIKPKLKKELRALRVVSLFEQKRVLIPSTHKNLFQFVQEHLMFPNAEHDDWVDTTTMALEYLLSLTPRPWRVL